MSTVLMSPPPSVLSAGTKLLPPSQANPYARLTLPWATWRRVALG